jgi:hypothetical protein
VAKYVRSIVMDGGGNRPRRCEESTPRAGPPKYVRSIGSPGAPQGIGPLRVGGKYVRNIVSGQARADPGRDRRGGAGGAPGGEIARPAIVAPVAAQGEVVHEK